MSQRNWPVIDWVLTRLRGYPRPALEGMRLAPAASSENGVMVSARLRDLVIGNKK